MATSGIRSPFPLDILKKVYHLDGVLIVTRKPEIPPLTQKEINEASAWFGNLLEEVSGQKFKDYCSRIDDGTATEIDHDEFYMRVIARFVAQTHKGETIDNWVQSALCRAFEKILLGGDWVDEFPLPWIEGTKIRPPHEQKNLEIYIYVAQTLIDDPARKVTGLISEAADIYCCSYEKAEAAYYKYKKKSS